MSEEASSTSRSTPTRLDTMFGGKLLLHQMTEGHRAGTDAVLLAAAAGIRPGDRFVDVGSGTGVVGLGLALREPEAQGVLLEVSADAAAIAVRNIEANQLQTRVAMQCVDLFDAAACRKAELTGAASLVVSNPPFYLTGDVRPSSHAGRAAAHVAQAGQADAHGEWLKQCCTLLLARGRLLVIHRPEALSSLLRTAERHLGGLVLRPVHAKAEAPAIRILLGGILGARAPLTILAPLVLHHTDGTFTSEAEALNQGDTMAFWPKKSRPVRAGFISGNIKRTQ